MAKVQRQRFAEFERETKETTVAVAVDLDGTGQTTVNTGVGFLDHMFALFAHHGRLDLTIQATGDLHVDEHHTIEDIAICLGQAVWQALGDKAGIERYGSATIPMDEALALVALDFSGRSFLRFDVSFTRERLGEMPTELFEEFFRAFSRHSRSTLHIRQISGENNHHIAEAVFKAFGRALWEATRRRAGAVDIPSTKGLLE